jgi:hypothetical protein
MTSHKVEVLIFHFGHASSLVTEKGADFLGDNELALYVLEFVS